MTFISNIYNKACYYLISSPDPKTGLTRTETDTIGQYIQSHSAQWSQLEGTFRIEKETSALPRTLQIIQEKDQSLNVMVHSNNYVGSGTFKRVTRAVDWMTKKLWAYSETYGYHDIKMAKEELVLEKVAQQHPLSRSVKPKSIGAIEHSENLKFGFFTPLFDGDLKQLIYKKAPLTAKINNVLRSLRFWDWEFFIGHLYNLFTVKPLTYKQQMQIMRRLIESLYVLEQKKLEHRDVKSGNILYKIDGDNIQVKLADFGCARLETDTPTIEESNIKHAPNAGNRYWLPPEKYLAQEIYAYLDNREAIISLMDDSWTKHDIWAMGLVLSHLFLNRENWLTRDRIIDKTLHLPLAEKRHIFSDLDRFFSHVFDAPAPFPEPSSHTPLHLIWQMLHYDYRQRPSASSLLHSFNHLERFP